MRRCAGADTGGRRRRGGGRAHRREPELRVDLRLLREDVMHGLLVARRQRLYVPGVLPDLLDLDALALVDLEDAVKQVHALGRHALHGARQSARQRAHMHIDSQARGSQRWTLKSRVSGTLRAATLAIAAQAHDHRLAYMPCPCRRPARRCQCCCNTSWEHGRVCTGECAAATRAASAFVFKRTCVPRVGRMVDALAGLAKPGAADVRQTGTRQSAIRRPSPAHMDRRAGTGARACTMSRLRSFSVQWIRICSKWTSLKARCSSAADDVECSNGNAPRSITKSSTPHAHTSAHKHPAHQRFAPHTPGAPSATVSGTPTHTPPAHPAHHVRAQPPRTSSLRHGARAPWPGWPGWPGCR